MFLNGPHVLAISHQICAYVKVKSTQISYSPQKSKQEPKKWKRELATKNNQHGPLRNLENKHFNVL